MTYVCKIARDHYNLLQAMKHEWENPPRGFNSSYDPSKTEKLIRYERMIKETLNDYHAKLKRLPNDIYYDLMNRREVELRKIN